MRTRLARLPALAAVLVLLGCSDDAEPADTEPDATASTGGDGDGDTAVWSLQRDARLSEATTVFIANVQRLACNSGVTGRVLEPTVTYGDTRVVVTFAVQRAPDGDRTCQANRMVADKVELSEPLGDRELVDGACLAGGEAATTSHCRKNGVRWPDLAPAAIQTTDYQGRRPLAYVLATGRIAYPLLGLTTWSKCAFEVERVRRVNDWLVRVVGRESSTRCSSRVKRRALSERLTRHEARDGVEEVVVVRRDPYFVVRAVVQHVVS